MNITWRHLAGFVIVSGVIFALGIAKGKFGTRAPRTIDPAAASGAPSFEGNYAPPIEQVSDHEATFADMVPTYPRRLGPEMPTGEMRDFFGFPTKTKTFMTEDSSDRVLAWYEQVFTIKSYRVYTVKEAWLTSLAAIDVLRKYVYYITIINNGPRKTRVIPAWVDGTKPPRRGKQLIPLEMGPVQPMMLTGDSKTHEMAIYVVDDRPGAMYDRCEIQLRAKGWVPAEVGSKMGRRFAKTQKLYVRENQELLISANKHGAKTVVFCLVGPRVG